MCICMSVCMCICRGWFSWVSVHQCFSHHGLTYMFLFVCVFICPCVCVYVMCGSRAWVYIGVHPVTNLPCVFIHACICVSVCMCICHGWLSWVNIHQRPSQNKDLCMFYCFRTFKREFQYLHKLNTITGIYPELHANRVLHCRQINIPFKRSESHDDDYPCHTQ